MFTKNLSLLCVAVAVVVVSLAGVTSVNAVVIGTETVTNGSFELPVVSDLGWGTQATGWSYSAAGATLTSVIFQGTSSSGARFPSGAPDGSQLQALAIAGTGTATMSQTITLDPDMIYSLSGFLGFDATNSGSPNPGATISVVGTGLSGTTAVSWAANEATSAFVYRSATFTTDSSGGNYTVQLVSHGGVSNPWVYVDAISVKSVGVVPEPSTMALLTASLLGLLAYAWRKRK